MAGSSASPGVDAVVLIRVTGVLGSAPREAGTAMLVGAADSEGTIGGGALEWRAMAIAREMLASGEEAHSVTLPLGPVLEQCCGGQVTLDFARVDREAARRAVAGERSRRPLVVLYGAGHVGKAMANLLATLPCRLLWLDPRRGIFPDPLPGDIDARVLRAPETTVPALPADAFHLVMTHSHALDLAVVEAVLRRGDFAWLGLIGSASKRARFEHRLRAAGIEEGLLRRLVCPIGIAGIAGKEPAVIAVATAAQLLRAFDAHGARAGLVGTEVAG